MSLILYFYYSPSLPLIFFVFYFLFFFLSYFGCNLAIKFIVLYAMEFHEYFLASEHWNAVIKCQRGKKAVWYDSKLETKNKRHRFLCHVELQKVNISPTAWQYCRCRWFVGDIGESLANIQTAPDCVLIFSLDTIGHEQIQIENEWAFSFRKLNSGGKR